MKFLVTEKIAYPYDKYKLLPKNHFNKLKYKTTFHILVVFKKKYNYI